jgi:hypothetical protein
MRRTRHRRRFHTDRIVSNRRARYLREQIDQWPYATNHDEWLAKTLSYGALADRDPWDCGRRCLLCHHDKFLEPRRAREDRQWRKDWHV